MRSLGAKWFIPVPIPASTLSVCSVFLLCCSVLSVFLVYLFVVSFHYMRLLLLLSFVEKDFLVNRREGISEKVILFRVLSNALRCRSTQQFHFHFYSYSIRLFDIIYIYILLGHHLESLVVSILFLDSGLHPRCNK